MSQMLTFLSYFKSLYFSKRCDACLAFVALQLAGVGLFASIASSCICNYFKVNGAGEGVADNLGIWRVPMNDTTNFLSCSSYPSDTPIDYNIRTARAMTVLAPTLCFLGMALSYFAEAGPTKLQERRLLMSICVLLAAAATQGLTLMTLESEVCVNNPNLPGDGSCALAFGAKLSIGSTSFMSAALFCLLITGRKEIEYDTNDQEYADPESYRSDDDTMNGPPSERTQRTGVLGLQHGTGRFKFVDIWGKLV